MASAAILQDPSWVLNPSYNIYRFTDQIYKVVHFRNPLRRLKGSLEVDRSRKGNASKLDQSISRAKRVVLEKALCNEWDWFGTFTLDKRKYDRYDLDKFHKDFTQWIRDQRKKHKVQISYILVPELHKDGAWHMHGLLRGLPGTVPFAELRTKGWIVPDLLVKGNYSCWLDFHRKFGFCSLGPIRDSVACGFYVTKYIGKSFQESGLSVGKHLYYASHGLLRATLHGDVYGESAFLDRFTVNHYDFCDTGMTHVNHELDWSFAMDLMHFEQLVPLDFTSIPQEDKVVFDQIDQYWQMEIDGFGPVS